MPLTTNKKPVSISLNEELVAAASALAYQAQELYSGCDGPYGDNSLEMHLVGKLGETALSNFFKSAGLAVKDDFATIDRESRSDLKIGIRRNWVRLEVKTFSESSWPDRGRVISEAQQENIRKNSDFIFWCCASSISGNRSVSVKIMGYSPVSDLLDSSLHCQAYKPETIQLSASSLRHPGRFCQDLEILFKAKANARSAQRKAEMIASCQSLRNNPNLGRYFWALHARRCVGGCIEAGFGAPR